MQRLDVKNFIVFQTEAIENEKEELGEFVLRQRSNSYEIESPSLQKFSSAVVLDSEDNNDNFLDKELLDNHSQ